MDAINVDSILSRTFNLDRYTELSRLERPQTTSGNSRRCRRFRKTDR